ncbi:MAG: ribose 5-phosphate isomerase B [Alphaproteobacteria bacterium]
MSIPTLAFSCDHAAVDMKNHLIAHAKSLGYEVQDFGTDSSDSVDYPDIVPPVTDAVLAGKAVFGIILCGSGIGVDIAANRIPGIRSALCHSGLLARYSRSHNNCNVLCLGARIIGVETAKNCLEEFLATEFHKEERHIRRVEKLG